MADTKSKKKQSNPVVLGVLVGVLMLGLLALIIDRNARHAAATAADRINEMLDRESPQTPSEVQRLVGHPPDEPLAEHRDRMIERYSWRGAMRSYFIYVSYLPGNTPLLDAVTLNQPPR